MGLCELVKAHSIADRPASLGAGPGLQLLAAVVIAIVAGTELREAYGVHGRRSVVLAEALVDAQQQLAQVQQTYRERLHDARSAVIGVVGASRLLSQSPVPPAANPRRLYDLMAAELGRLQDTLDTERVEPLEEFALTDVFEPVVLSHRLAGGAIEVDLGILRALGRPKATATALANLLANARTHAPGASVSLYAEQHGTTVAVVVDDDGGGIPVSERDRVLLPGVRGSTSGSGSGLGLHTAAAAMTAQSGTLRLTERPGGGTRAVLTLPAAKRAGLAAAGSIRAQAC
jgi:signal transduction histidine kinase